jgi:Tfp pilus assembly protein PilX
VLFVALLVLVVLGLASVALFRSVDTATIVAGNLASQQAAAAAVDHGIEKAIEALWEAPGAIVDRTQHAPAQNYYACVQGSAGECLAAGSSIPEIPTALASLGTFAAAGLNAALVPDDDAGNAIRYVIERMCLATGPAVGSNCNLATLPHEDAGTQHFGEAGSAGDAFYRVTVLVTGPRHTVVHAQAMLR